MIRREKESVRDNGSVGEVKTEKECVTVVVKGGFDDLRESCGCARPEGYEWLVPCVRACAAVALRRAWRAEAMGNGEKKAVA